MHLLARRLRRSTRRRRPSISSSRRRKSSCCRSPTAISPCLRSLERVRSRWRAGLRLASLADLKHPDSVDLYVERVVAHARVVLVRLLGGLDYWRYGVEEIARWRRAGVPLAVLPGDDARTSASMSLDAAGRELRRLWGYLQSGGVGNAAQALRFISARVGSPLVRASRASGRFRSVSRSAAAPARRPASADRVLPLGLAGRRYRALPRWQALAVRGLLRRGGRGHQPKGPRRRPPLWASG